VEVECGLVVDYINGSLPFEKQWREEVEEHLAICRECQKLMELMNGLPELADGRIFSSGMKARILAMVFEEWGEPDPSSPGSSM